MRVACKPDGMIMDVVNIGMPALYKNWMAKFARVKETKEIKKTTAAQLYRDAVWEYIVKHYNDKNAPDLDS